MSQINLRLSEDLRRTAAKFAKQHGYKSLQELAREALRMKVYEKESLKETLDIMKNKELMASIARSREDVKKGRVITFSSVKELRKRYK